MGFSKKKHCTRRRRRRKKKGKKVKLEKNKAGDRDKRSLFILLSIRFFMFTSSNQEINSSERTLKEKKKNRRQEKGFLYEGKRRTEKEEQIEAKEIHFFTQAPFFSG